MSGGAVPRLTNGADYGTWAPLFLNWASGAQMRDSFEKEAPNWVALAERVDQWKQEALQESFAYALGESAPSTSSSSSFTSPSKAKVKSEDPAAERAMRATVVEFIGRSRRAFAALFNALPDDLRKQISTPDGYAFALWRWLENKFQSKEADSVREWSKGGWDGCVLRTVCCFYTVEKWY